MAVVGGGYDLASAHSTCSWLVPAEIHRSVCVMDDVLDKDDIDDE
jgi:hypothetical protein